MGFSLLQILLSLRFLFLLNIFFFSSSRSQVSSLGLLLLASLLLLLLLVLLLLRCQIFVLSAGTTLVVVNLLFFFDSWGRWAPLRQGACNLHVNFLDDVLVLIHLGSCQLACLCNLKYLIISEANDNILRFKVGMNDLAHAVHVIKANETLSG